MDPKHPTNPDWVMYDPVEKPAPQGVELLLLNEGGSLIKGQWYDGAQAWCFKPKVPASVKARMSARTRELRASNWAVGQRVVTHFSGRDTEHIIRRVCSDGSKGWSQSGVVFQLNPPVPKSGGASRWIDSDWFRKASEQS